MKSYADHRRHATTSTVRVGDTVLVKTPKINKFSSYYDPKPYKITNIKGTMATASRPEHTLTRNITIFKKTTATVPEQQEEEEEDDDDIGLPTPVRQHQQQPPGNQQQANQQPPPQPQQRRYPQRQSRRLPARLSDFVVN